MYFFQSGIFLDGAAPFWIVSASENSAALWLYALRPLISTALFDLRGVHPVYSIERCKEIRPCLTLLVENFATRGSQFVVTSSTLTGLLDPASFDPTPRLKPVKQRIERSDVKLEHTIRTLLDKLG